MKKVCDIKRACDDSDDSIFHSEKRVRLSTQERKRERSKVALLADNQPCKRARTQLLK